jgi:putative peptide zinc metalloprotease protein
MNEWQIPARLRDDLVVSEQETDGQKFFILKDPVTFRYFRLREPEYYLIRQFDGKTDCDTIAQRLRDKFKLNISAEAVEKFAQRVDELYFFEGGKAEYEISSGRYLSRTRKSLFSNILFIKLKAFNPDRLLNFLLPITRFLFRPWAIALMVLFIFAGFFTYSANWAYFKFDPTGLYSVGSLLIVIVSIAVLILLHEFAHALTCKFHGGQVHEMGLLLLYFQLCFYTNLSDSWMFKRKSHRLAVIWAGLFFQMVLFAMAVFGWRVTVIGTGINHLFWLTANVSFLMLLFNFNPLIKLDGYYFLSEWVNIPNLRNKSFAYMRHCIKRVIGVSSLTDASRREKRTYFWYMLLAGAYSVLLITIVAYIVYRFLIDNLSGFGFILFLILLAVIFKRPIVRGIRFVVNREVIRALVFKKRNIIVGSVLIVAAIIILFAIPIPRQVGGDITIRPMSEYTITLFSGQGLLELKLRRGGQDRNFKTEHIQLSTGELSVLQLTPLVSEGDDVQVGDTLAAIMSNEVSSGLTSARAELERLQGELALAQSPPKPEEIATAQAAVNAARANVEQLEKDIQRNQSLHEKKLISRQELEQSQALLKISLSYLEETEAKLLLLKSPPKKEEVDILKSQIASQEADISYLMSQEAAQVITSPIKGIVTTLYRENLLFKISKMSQVEVAIPITDNYLEFVETGAEVRLRARTYPNRTFVGNVSHIASSADNSDYDDNRARFAIHAVLGNSNLLLRDGMSGYAKISCGSASLASIIVERVKALIRVEFWSWW